jgi:hypothetical protein
MLMFKECLANDVMPFIIDEESKAGYYDGLREFYRDEGVFMAYITGRQEAYRAMAERYTKPAHDVAAKRR